VERFRGGLVCKALGLLYHSTLGSRVLKKHLGGLGKVVLGLSDILHLIPRRVPRAPAPCSVHHHLLIAPPRAPCGCSGVMLRPRHGLPRTAPKHDGRTSPEDHGRAPPERVGPDASRAARDASHARPFVGVFQKSISIRFINFWRYFPAKMRKWLQEQGRDTPTKGLVRRAPCGGVACLPGCDRAWSGTGVSRS